MGILDAIGEFLGFKKTIKHIELDPESVKHHNMIRALANENASLKGENAKLLSNIGSLRESEKDIIEEEEVRFELNEQKQEIHKNTFPKYFSLKAFFNKVHKSKRFRNKLGFYSFDGAEKLGKFGDIGFSNSGVILLNDNGQVVLSGKKLKDLFWSVRGLGTDVTVGKMPLCMDSDGGYLENPMVWEAPELTPTSDGKFRYTKARKKPFYEYIKELLADIGEKQSYIEELELTNTSLNKNSDDLSISQRVAEDMAQTSRKELSVAETSTSAIGRVFRDNEKELISMRTKNIVAEEEIESLTEAMKKLKEKAEEEGVALKFEDVIARIDRLKPLFRQRTLAPPQQAESKPQNM